MSTEEPRRDQLPDDLADRAAEQLLDAAEPERAAVLAALVSAHPRHVAGLQRLLAELGGTEQLLATTYPDSEVETVTHIGGHRVLRQLGEGAFGIVYLCAQEQPVVRHVAVKVLRPGAGDRQTLRRFAAERQLLASLNHPAITQVFDAGVLADGRPYFVMEYVKGVPITRPASVRGAPSPGDADTTLAMPKSMIFGCGPVSVSTTNTLVGLRSRCTMPRLCAWLTPRPTSTNRRKRSWHDSRRASQ